MAGDRHGCRGRCVAIRRRVGLDCDRRSLLEELPPGCDTHRHESNKKGAEWRARPSCRAVSAGTSSPSPPRATGATGRRAHLGGRHPLSSVRHQPRCANGRDCHRPRRHVALAAHHCREAPQVGPSGEADSQISVVALHYVRVLGGWCLSRRVGPADVCRSG